MIPTILIFTIALWGTPAVSANSTASAKFGDPCNKAIPCNTEGHLVCSSHVCQCVKPENMVYDEGKGACVSLPGEPCFFEGLETKRGEKFPEITVCDRNSVCDKESSVCVCDKDYILSGNRSCIGKYNFKEECSLDEAGNHLCRPDKGFTCIENKCGCDEAYAVYDEDRDECVALEGSSCVGYANCVANAQCPFRITGSFYHSVLCSCLPGFSRSPTALCLANHGEPCNMKDKRCGVDLMCKNSKCECKFPERQKYDRESNRCISFVLSPCFIKFKTESGAKANISFPCVKNAECKQVDGYLHECMCTDKYIESEDTCDLEYGQPCGDTIEEPCDRLAPLECIDSRCRCSSEFLYYDTASKKCRGLIGSNCKLSGPKDFCTGGAECRATRNVRSEYGSCRCTHGYHTISGRKCLHHLLVRGPMPA